MTLSGIPVSPGISLGIIVRYEKKISDYSGRPKPAESPEKEIERFLSAVSDSSDQLKKMSVIMLNEKRKTEFDIINSQICLLRDPEIIESVKEKILTDRKSAETALSEVLHDLKSIFLDMDDDPYLKERAQDIDDAGCRILANLAGENTFFLKNLPSGSVLAAEDLGPSDTAQLNKDDIEAIVVEKGGETSHTAILAKAMGITAVVGIKGLMSSVKNGARAAVDGCRGYLTIEPSEEEVKHFREAKRQFAEKIESMRKYKNSICLKKDGSHVSISANAGSLKEVEQAADNGADGIGLFRTEFLFLDRDRAPDEEEQYNVYKKAAELMKDKPVIIRTLDIGGDKDVPYMNLPHESNPFLGVRAIRLCLKETDIFKTQIRAVLRAAVSGNIKIMFPMVKSSEEILQVKALMDTCAEELKREGKPFRRDLAVGIMIEIPAAAVISEELAGFCDFFSIGTNDLTQYTLAVDRTNEALASHYNQFHPAVLELVKKTISSARDKKITCGMCGELASKPEAAPLLIDYGLNEFSVDVNSILRMKKLITGILQAENN